MPIAVPEQPRARATGPAVSLPIARLADTFDDATQPVWIHDPAGRCLYANGLAKSRDPHVGTILFDLLDHAGRLVGRMRTLAA